MSSHCGESSGIDPEWQPIRRTKHAVTRLYALCLRNMNLDRDIPIRASTGVESGQWGRASMGSPPPTPPRPRSAEVGWRPGRRNERPALAESERAWWVRPGVLREERGRRAARSSRGSSNRHITGGGGLWMIGIATSCPQRLDVAETDGEGGDGALQG